MTTAPKTPHADTSADLSADTCADASSAERPASPASPSLDLLPLVHANIRAKLRITPTGCWEWQAGKSDGYGIVWIGDKAYRVHRRVYADLVEPLPRTVPLDHLCRNRACCNLDHLEPVSAALNCQRGLKARLTPDQVRRIRQLKHAGRIGRGPGRRTMEQVGAAYGVSGATISRILAYKLWTNIP